MSFIRNAWRRLRAGRFRVGGESEKETEFHDLAQAMKNRKRRKWLFHGGTWQINPVTRVKDSKKKYSRPRVKTALQNQMSKKLKFGLPKGSLQEATIQKMAKAGFNISVSSRSYMPYVDDDELEIRLIRSQEISRYVEHGYLDCGIAGYDWIAENDSNVHEVGEFLFSKATRQPARWVSVRAGKFADQIGERFEGQTHRHGSRQSDKKISQEKRREGRGGIFVGRDGDEGARVGGRDCRIDGDRFIAAREQAAHRGHAVDFDAASDREQRRVEKSVEAQKNRDARASARRRAGGGNKGRLEDEHRAKKSGAAAEGLPALRNPTISSLSLERLGRRGDDH
jgi:hypothetical protein